MYDVQNICRKALHGLMRPVVRFCLMRAIRFREVSETLKLTYVQLAREELQRLGEQETMSRVSAMTGVQRREVGRLLELDHVPGNERDMIARIVGLWQSGRRFRDRTGHPRVLSFIGREGEFAELVSRVSTDLNPYTIAFELTRSGLAEQTDQGMKLKKPGYEPKDDPEDSFRLLAEDSEILHQAVEENIFGEAALKNLHVKTRFDNIPAKFEPEIRRWFLEQGGEFHARAREFLGSLDRDLNPELAAAEGDGDTICAAVGTVSLISQRTTGEKD